MIKKLKTIFLPCLENSYKPKIFEGNFLFYWGLLIFFLKISLFPFYFYLPHTSFFAEIVKNVLIDLANQTRIQLGLAPLKENVLLSEAASLKAQDMLTKDYFAHKSPEGTFAWDLLKKLGYTYKIAGENLAIGYLDSEEVHQAWLASPSHKANIINSQFQEIGLAVSKGNFEGNDVYVVVQIFGTPKIVQSKTATNESEFAKKPENTLAPTPVKNTPEPEVLPAETIQKEENQQKDFSILKEEASLISEVTNAVSIKENDIEKEPSFKIAKFLLLNYNNFLQKFIYGSLLVIIFLLLITILVKIEIQYPDLIFKTLSFIALMAFFLWLDKEYILQIMFPNKTLLF